LEPEELGATVAELRQHLANLLPKYMIPTYLVVVESFPLNTSGKIDKSKLPAPDASGEAADYVAPRTLIESVLADMYARLLGHEQVGVDDSFFDLGGNSLQAMQLITQIDAELAADIDVGVTAVFLAPTARRLAELLRDKHGIEDVDLSDEETAAALMAME
jgi:hypothetical protein